MKRKNPAVLQRDFGLPEGSPKPSPAIRTTRSAEEKLALLEEIIPQIARAVGPLCEMVLHERHGAGMRIRAIANSHISRRRVGGPMGSIFLGGKEIDDLSQAMFNYTGRTQDRKRLRCSLIPVQHGGETIGLICVNFLIHDLSVARDAISALLKNEVQADEVSEYVPSQSDLFEEIFQECLSQSGRTAELLTRKEKVALLGALRARGVLKMRGAVDRLAERLNVSRTAIYNYLRELNTSEPRTAPAAPGA